MRLMRWDNRRDRFLYLYRPVSHPFSSRWSARFLLSAVLRFLAGLTAMTFDVVTKMQLSFFIALQFIGCRKTLPPSLCRLRQAWPQQLTRLLTLQMLWRSNPWSFDPCNHFHHFSPASRDPKICWSFGALLRIAIPWACFNGVHPEIISI